MNRLYLFDLLRVQEFLERNFRRRITMNDISRICGYSPWHCRRIFQQYYGESLSGYLLRLRLEAGKKDLRNGRTVAETAAAVGFCSREGFAKAFLSAYGVSPGKYAKGEPARERYAERFEYYMSSDLWARGENPTEDNLWSFLYYDKRSKECWPMRWTGEYFEAPFSEADMDDPSWYCQNRFNGYGMHPGKECNAVKSFLCPQSGVLEYFISLGRISELCEDNNPCSVRIYHESTPLYPLDGPLVLSDRRPVVIRGVCNVSRGDRISVVLDAMGHIGRDGVMLYRQQMGYLTVFDEI